MQAIQIIGFKKSGKTTLSLELTRELKRRGLNVAFAKFTSHGTDKADTDTSRLLEQGVAVAGMGPHDAAVFWPGERDLRQLIPLLRADVLVVEGGKNLDWMPRILALRAPEEAEELGADLALGSYGPIRAPWLRVLENMGQVADLVLEQGFVLPGLNCGACGREDCRTLAREIVAGDASREDCKALKPGLKVEINGSRLAMNPFVENILSAGISAMLKELKGWAPGSVVIHLDG